MGRWQWVTDVAKSFEEGKVYTKMKPVFEGEGTKDVLPSAISHVDTVFPSMSASEMIARSTVKPMRVIHPTIQRDSVVKPMRVIRQQLELPKIRLTGEEAKAFLSDFEKSTWTERTGTNISDEMLAILKGKAEYGTAFKPKTVNVEGRCFQLKLGSDDILAISERDPITGKVKSQTRIINGKVIDEKLLDEEERLVEHFILTPDGLTKFGKADVNGKFVTTTRGKSGKIVNITTNMKSVASAEEGAVTVYNGI